MKQDIKALCILNLSILILLVYKSLDLISMANDKPFTTGVITAAEYNLGFPGLPRTDENGNEIKIPKIIHQTYKSENIPDIWKGTQESVIENTPGYQYILWTDAMARDFIAAEYSWFLPTFDSYPYPIMRADSLRYFVLYHYGGIYIDLDNGVKQPLDKLLSLSAFFPKTDPTGVSNDIMACSRGHPLFGRLIEELRNYNRNFILPYITIMYSTGPLFVSMVLQKYLRSHSSVDDPYRVRILMPDSPQNSHLMTIRQLFGMLKGQSWHQSDAEYITMIGDHLLPFISICVIASCFSLVLIFYIELTFINFALPAIRWTFRRLVSIAYRRKNDREIV